MSLFLLLILLACFLPPRTQAGSLPTSSTQKPGDSSESEVDRKFWKEHHKKSLYRVTLGAHDISKKERTQQVIPVSRGFLHPNYTAEKSANDIMLLKLARKAKLTSAVQLLSLPSPRAQVRPGQVCSVAGWGRAAPYHQKSSNILLEVNLTMQDDYQCQSRFPEEYIKATQLCAGDPNLRKGAFLGDSGGPLVCKNVAQGIVSYGEEHGVPPGVYTKISSFLPWIHKTMQRWNGRRLNRKAPTFPV